MFTFALFDLPIHINNDTGGGHIIRTLVFGLISNAFDVGSDLLNAFQYYRYFIALVVQGLGKF